MWPTVIKIINQTLKNNMEIIKTNLNNLKHNRLVETSTYPYTDDNINKIQQRQKRAKSANTYNVPKSNFTDFKVKMNHDY